MKIKDNRSGILTNFEVLQHLQSRGAKQDRFGSLGIATQSECKVFDYLVQTVAANQTRENINEFLKRSEKHKLTTAEKVQIVNLSPARPVELFVDNRSGILTNFEVLQHLQSRGAKQDRFGSLGIATQSECKVFDYLVQTVAANQTRENINEFLKRSEKHKLTTAEKVQIVNLSPARPVELFVIMEQLENRMDEDQVDEILQMVVELLPPRGNNPDEDDDPMEQDQEAQ